ncbi:MAG: hypothetical protein E7434_00690 [Ruminococcaceae bacterium]|nr:hypothetical protein [Oscillospiraceae bacterium]
MNIRNVKLRLNLDRPEDRRVFDFLQSKDDSYTKTVVSALCEYLDRSDEKTREDMFLTRLTAIIKEEMANHNPLAGLLNMVQTASAQTPFVPPTVEKEEAAETEEALLGFLDNF